MEKYLRYKDSEMIAKFENIELSRNLLKDKSWHEIGKVEYERLMSKQICKSQDNVEEIINIKNELAALSEDMIQIQFGASIKNFEEKKKRFAILHNRLRQIEGKQARVY